MQFQGAAPCLGPHDSNPPSRHLDKQLVVPSLPKNKAMNLPISSPLESHRR